MNNKNELHCLYYANSVKYKTLLSTKRTLQAEYENQCFVKHFLTGKNTSHRFGKKEKRHNFKKSKVSKINRILAYTKAIKRNKEILKNLEGFRPSSKNFYEFIHGKKSG